MTGIETKNYKAGEVIYNINDPADKIYLIHNGKVRVKSKAKQAKLDRDQL